MSAHHCKHVEVVGSLCHIWWGVAKTLIGMLLFRGPNMANSRAAAVNTLSKKERKRRRRRDVKLSQRGSSACGETWSFSVCVFLLCSHRSNQTPPAHPHPQSQLSPLHCCCREKVAESAWRKEKNNEVLISYKLHQINTAPGWDAVWGDNEGALPQQSSTSGEKEDERFQNRYSGQVVILSQ